MGREAIVGVTWRGETAEVKLQLEGTELILRGGIKSRIARGTIAEVRADADGLWLSADGEVLHADFAEAEAQRWAKAILTPPPSLASKLGIDRDKPALVLGAVDDAALAGALEGAVTADPGRAVVIVALIETEAALAEALERSRQSGLPLWCVYPKGKAADPGEGAIRAALRGAGMMDNKTSAVSDRLTATRYGWPKDSRR